jgi:Cupredoxin-like domain
MTTRRWSLVLAVWTALVATGCRAEDKASDKSEGGRDQTAEAAPAKLPPPAAPGQARRIDIRVDDQGYHPPSAPARTGEKLILVFTRHSDSECVREVIVDGKTTELPLKRPVEIPVTMPASGDLVFTCGMKMFEGRVVLARN